MASVMHPPLLAAAACLLALASGCAQTSLFNGSAKIEAATAKEPAVQLLCIWQPARGRGPNGMPTRGMAGQLMFFTQRSPSPVAVDGDVRIYLFDDLGTPEEQAKPIHKFDFASDTWQAHLRNGNLGPSYHIFIPYVRGGHRQVECSLQVRFTPKDGPVVHSEMVSVVLPGTTEKNAEGHLPLAAARRRSEATGPTSQQSESTKPSLAVHTIRPQELHRRPSPAASAGRPIVDHAVQQVSAAVDSTPVADEDRLARLERMMAQLLDTEDAPTRPQQARRPSAVHPLLESPRSAATHPLADAEPAVSETNRRRFRLAPASPEAGAHPLARGIEERWPEEPREPSPEPQHPLNTGIGTSHYPDWMPADFDAAGAERSFYRE